MNTDIAYHPTLQHVGIITPNADAMLDWYKKVLGLVAHQRVDVPAGRAPFRTVVFATNDEVNHRISFFEVPAAEFDVERARHSRVQHIAFAYRNLDELLGSYLRLKKLGFTLLWAADQFFQTAMYYADPDRNIIELNCDNFTDPWAVTDQLKALPSQLHVYIDLDKMAAARETGESPWRLHERALAGEFLPADNYELSRSYW